MFIDEYILMDVPYMVKYQPRDIDDFQASMDVRDYIKVCVDTHDLNLLLIGDPGTGKTSLLNIIIRMYFGDAIGDRHVYDAHILFINSLREQGISFYTATTSRHSVRRRASCPIGRRSHGRHICRHAGRDVRAVHPGRQDSEADEIPVVRPAVSKPGPIKQHHGWEIPPHMPR